MLAFEGTCRAPRLGVVCPFGRGSTSPSPSPWGFSSPSRPRPTRASTSLAETGQWIGHTHEVLAAIAAVAAATTTAETGARGYALTGEERFLETYQGGRARRGDRARHACAG